MRVFDLGRRGGGVGGCGPEHPREFYADAGRTCKDIKSGKLHMRRFQRENELHMKANWKQATAETSDKTKCRSRPHMSCLGDNFFFSSEKLGKSEGPWDMRDQQVRRGTALFLTAHLKRLPVEFNV